MECGNPTTESDALMPRKRKYDKSRTCVKCKVNVGNVVVRHAVYCRSCFVSQMTYKFRRSLEPYVNAKPDGPRRTALKPTGNLLVAFSGGLSSTVLLDLVNRCYVSPDPALLTTDGGRDHPRHERVWKKVYVCYVECCDVLPGTKDRTNEIRDVVAQIADVEFIPLRIQNAFDHSWWRSVSHNNLNSDVIVDLNDEMLPFATTGSSTRTPLAALQSYLAALPTPTALPTALHTLVRVLLQHTAAATASSHLLLGTSLTGLAGALLAGVAQGGGFHVRAELQEEWAPPAQFAAHSAAGSAAGPAAVHPVKTVRLVRPLREASAKECAVWAWWARLRVVGRAPWAWPGAKPGIGRLTNDFVRGLEKDYPSTVSTVVRTCAKLAPKGAAAGACVLCERPAQDGVQAWKTRIAIRARDGLRRGAHGRPAAEARGESDGEADGEAGGEVEAELAAEPRLAPLLCYVCHTSLTSRGARAAPALYADTVPSLGAVPLPAWVSARLVPGGRDGAGEDEGEREEEEPVVVKRKMGEEELRRAIGEFILE
ncbi:cytoplasmic tRNA 2-thiolation protein [Phanerochaete sordida]|uniref:Cytoplasmic tRNA 2-thiolation protein 2 n=1 Tax=Phanerochaete sordida TaxID=48140 RepID=A0A9P3G6W5_9APHY|nr:cytoplasmic tRNA 2-thiolation protein [Phanerochaete sordida]